MGLLQTVTLVTGGEGRALARRIPAYRLRVVKGPDRRRQLQSSSERLILGTGEGAGLRLCDTTVSALHAELRADESGFHVRDLGSKNGVFVAGVRVQDAWVENGAELVLGATTVRFELREEIHEEPLAAREKLGELVGGSPRMRELYALLERAAASDAPVLLRGESGVGKDAAALGLVGEGPRKDRPFVVLDCPGLSVTLAESELFGHEQGSFTGADRAHAGAFERADGGTLYLDEVGELPPSLQAKLLGVLERGEVQRIGAAAPRKVDVRVIASTRHDLESAVNDGKFRADLYYRLAVLQIRLPSLREHAEDIPTLVAHFREALPWGDLSALSLQRLLERSYPGNVRELRNAVERAAYGLPEPTAEPLGNHAAVRIDLPFRLQKARLVEDFERTYLRALIEACRGNVSEAARRSGMDRMHLHGLLRKLGLTG